LPKSAILPAHTELLDNYILFFELNLYFSENNLTEMNQIKEVLYEIAKILDVSPKDLLKEELND
jgi:hypothetical protein